MDDSAVRARKLAGLLLLAAGFSGCVSGPLLGKLALADISKVPPGNPSPASAADVSNPENAGLAAATTKAGATGTPTLEIPEIPIADPLKPPKIEVPFELDPVTAEEPSRLKHGLGLPPDTGIPELPGNEVASDAADEAPGKVFIRSDPEIASSEPALDDVDEIAAPAEDAPGRAFICDNETPVVVYQELPVAVPADRWPGNTSGRVAAANRRNLVKRRGAAHDTSTRGIVRYVDKAQDSAQIVFAGFYTVEPGTRIAVRHQLLYGRLASTEFLEVVSAEPGAAIVRPIGNAHLTKTAIGDPVIVLND